MVDISGVSQTAPPEAVPDFDAAAAFAASLYINVKTRLRRCAQVMAARRSVDVCGACKWPFDPPHCNI